MKGITEDIEGSLIIFIIVMFILAEWCFWSKSVLWGNRTTQVKPADQVKNILNFEVWLPWKYFTGLEKKLEFKLVLWEGSEWANGLADFENIFAWISDSKQDFNGFLDPVIAADCRFIYFLGPDFGLWV